MSGKENFEKVAAITGGMAAGTLGGVATANTLFPPTVHLAEGIAVKASLAPGVEGATATYGPTVIHMPHVPVETPLIHASLNLDITQFNVPLNSHGIAEIAGLASQFHSAVEEPIKNALIERLATGAGVGALIGGIIGYKIFRKLQQKGVTERFQNGLEKFRNNRLRTVGALGLTSLMLAGCAVDGVYPFDSENIPSGPSPTLVSNIYPNNVNALKDSTISGTGGYFAKAIIKAGVTYTDAVSTFWQNAATKFDSSYSSYASGAGNKYKNNKDIVGIMQLSDLHCNYAAYQYYLGDVIQKFKPSIILNNGDVFTNSNTMPYEKDCATDFMDDVKQADKINDTATPVVAVSGNHDSGQTFPGETMLDSRNNYTAKVDTITFVGAPDPTRTTWSTQPSDPVKHSKDIANQGSLVAEKACEIKKSTGEAPVVAVHSQGAGYEVARDGCASMIDIGHTHVEEPVKQFIANDGSTGLWHIDGTATGANIGLTIEQTPQLPATLMMQYFNKKTREFVGFTNLTLTAGGDVSIDTQNVPDSLNATSENTFDSANAEDFLHLYSTTYGKKTP